MFHLDGFCRLSLPFAMRLNCDVEVVNRMLPGYGMRSRGKGARALLSIGRHVDKRTHVQSVYLLICTGRDKAGTKYKVVLCCSA
ncbi:leucine-rich repeat protein 1-like [Arapaima gigas]